MARKTTTAPARARRELIDIDPAQLEVDDQVRTDATPDEGLIEAVRELGIIQPPTVYFDDARDAYVIITGHRRVGAAIIAGLSSIEVIVGSKDDVADARRAQRQLAENERRKQLTPLDVARGYAAQQLFGLTPAEIAHQVGEKPDRVQAALKAVESEQGRAALDGGVDLTQAAIIAEFAATDPATADRLLEVAQDYPTEFGRHAARAENERLLRARRHELEAELEQQGIQLHATVSYMTDSWVGEGAIKGARTINMLQTRGADIDPSTHGDCPGHGAIIGNAFAADHIEIAYVCTQPALHQTAEQQETASRNDDFARQHREREAQRAQLIADLKANSTPRREWLRGFLTGRLNQTPGIFDLIADMHIGAIVLDDYGINEVQIAIELLTGSPSPQGDDYALAQMIQRGEVTPLRALAAHALGVAEYFADGYFGATSAPRTLIAYYRRLQIWGYPLTELDTTRLEEARTALAEDEGDGQDAVAAGGTDAEEGAA